VARSESDQPLKPEKLAYREALFDAKFSTAAPLTSPLEMPMTQGALNKVSLVASIASGLPLNKTDHTDCQLKGVWSTLFEKQLQRCRQNTPYKVKLCFLIPAMHGREGFGYFKGVKLQSFSGIHCYI